MKKKKKKKKKKRVFLNIKNPFLNIKPPNPYINPPIYLIKNTLATPPAPLKKSQISWLAALPGTTGWLHRVLERAGIGGFAAILGHF
jgi:hypothetical protein